MNLFEKHTEDCLYKIDAVFPTICVNKKISGDLDDYRLTKIDLSTKFILKEYKTRAIIYFRIFGFGLYCYFSWREN